MTPRAITKARLASLIERFEGRRVAVVGDLVADEFVYGDISRVSREAPVLILEHRETVVAPGGGGNTVANLRALGARPIPVGVVGADLSGKHLLAHFRKIGVPTSCIRTEDGYETPTKSRILAGGTHTRRQQVVRVDRGASHGSLPPPLMARIGSRLGSALREAEGLLVADYGYGVATPQLVRMARSARPRSLPVTVDSRARVAEFKSAAASTPNQEELERALGLAALTTQAQVERAGGELLRLSGNRAVLVTRGAKGMCLIERGRPPRHILPHGTEEVADVTGAGDTVIAVFTLALLAGASFLEAAVLSNTAAGLVVMKAGTATVGPAEMLQALDEVEIP